jgi:hypothetical protein
VAVSDFDAAIREEAAMLDVDDRHMIDHERCAA